MKVTKRIEEYIRAIVHSKFEPEYEKLEKPMQERTEDIKAAVAKAEQAAHAFLLPVLKKYYNDEQANAVLSLYYFDKHWGSRGIDSKSDMEKRCEDEIARLQVKEEKIINSIMIELEFEGTKEKLDQLLSSVDPVA